MDDKARFGEDVAVTIPLHPPDEYGAKMDENPPEYEYPRVDFSSGWKDRGFAIAFWIHVSIVIILAFVLGVPTIIPYIRSLNELSKKTTTETNETLINIEMKPILLGLGSASIVAGLSSFLIFFLLQQCASHFIKMSFLIIIVLQVVIGIGLFFVFWPLCFIPGTFLTIILICFCCLRKRISFAEAHLKAGCAALRSHPSLILVAIIMLIVEVLWFIFWFLMALGIHRVTIGSTSISANNTNETMNHSKLMLITTTPSLNDGKIRTSNRTIYSTRKDPNQNTSNTLEQIHNLNRKVNQISQGKWFDNYGQNLVGFLLLLSWYWGAITFGNIGHFITACMVGQWWFNNNDNQQYSMRKSIRRAFTTSFGTICFGSFFEALIKAIRRNVENNNRRNQSIVACIIGCILQIIEKAIGYLNEWAFIFAALTGQGFVQASKSFLELFKQRGWTAIINDTVIGTTLGFINFGIAIMSAVAAGLIFYFINEKPLEQIIVTIMIIIFGGFLIGLFMSSVITSILVSCVRTIFVCFALNPAALGATHPDHLYDLTKVWHKFYPQEFTTSGYANQFKQPIDSP